MKKKLKIAMYVSSNASQAGGDKEHILNLSTYLNDKGHKVDIYGPINNIYPFKNYFPITESIFLPLPGKNNVAANIPLRESKEIIHKINLRKYDIVHIHDPQTPFFTYELMKEIKGIKIATFHNAWDNNSVLNIFNPILPLLEETFYKYYQGAIFVSKLVEKRWFHLCKNRPNKIIYSGVGKNFKPVKKNKINKTINLLFLGRLAQRKNPIFLIKLFKKTVKIIPNLFLTFVGKGKLEKDLKLYIKQNNLRKNVFLKGEIFGDKRIKEYQKADIFCAPYVDEAFGLTIIEAMACGVPIIGFNYEALKEILKNYPNHKYLVESKNQNKFMDAIIDLANNKEEREKLGKWCIRESKKFSWNTATKETEDFYYKVLKK